jgi:Predicted NADH:ubiquinone oxidoreductase, subunit RnfG
MKQYLKVGGILFLICAAAALCLALVNSITAPQIALNVQQKTEDALLKVSAGYALGAKAEGDGEAVVYTIELTDPSGAVKGYITELTGAGYGGTFSLVASYDRDGVLLDAMMMGNSETPGLGKKSEESWYMDLFRGKGSDKPLPLKKSDLESSEAAAVSGASVTFGAVSRALNHGSEYVKSLGGR